jgi:NTE family protein
MEALQFVGGLSTPLDHVHRVVVFVVNSLSLPKVAWDKSESLPGTMQIFVKRQAYRSTTIRTSPRNC